MGGYCTVSEGIMSNGESTVHVVDNQHSTVFFLLSFTFLYLGTAVRWGSKHFICSPYFHF